MDVNDLEKVIQRAVEILSTGGIVVYPTETVYGIGCDPLNADSCRRVQSLKNRPEAKAMLLLACSREQVERMTGPLGDIPGKLAQRFWPGPLTLIVEPLRPFPDHLIGFTGGVAFRVTSHRVAGALAGTFGRPVISTSANMAGEPPVRKYRDARRLFGNSVDMVIPCGDELTGVPSTVVDCTAGRLTMVREGGITMAQLEEVAYEA